MSLLFIVYGKALNFLAEARTLWLFFFRPERYWHEASEMAELYRQMQAGETDWRGNVRVSQDEPRGAGDLP